MERLIQSHQEHKAGVYRITSASDFNKVYIGSSRNLTKRFYGHINKLTHGKHPNIHLQRQYNKYDDLTFEILGLCPIEDLVELEQLILDESKTYKELFNINPRCENRTGTKHTLETRKKISLKKAGVPTSRRGIKASDELRRKLSIAHTGLPSPLKGIPRKQWHIEAMKEGMKKEDHEKRKKRFETIAIKRLITYKANKETIIANRLKNKPQYKWIIQCDMSGNPIKEIHGVKEAAKQVGVQPSRITDCLKGRRNSTHGFKFIYKW